MRYSFPRLLGAVLLASSTIVAVPASSIAAKGDCGQPVSTGSAPTTVDALTCLKSSVGQATQCDLKPCICDVNCSHAATTADCLLLLKRAVGQPIELHCCCPDKGPACTSARIESRPGSELDSGWTGVAHNSELISGASIDVRILRRCSNDGAVCERDADCGSGNDCVPTCDCNYDTSCEGIGPTHTKNCFNSLAECTANADCPSGQPCLHFFGPPLPLSSGGTPVCVVTTFAGPLTGTADSATGEGNASATLRSRVYLGIQLDKPCPTCGTVDDGPEVGQEFTCGGGPNDGQPCTVDGISSDFGGTSFSCPPAIGDNVSGAGLAVRFNEITTGTSTRTAQLPCGGASFKANNPLTPGGSPKCIDKVAAGDPPCSTNADCKRCTLDPATACTTSAQCTGKGTCAEAPDQPVTCGYWCNCGFCNDNPDLPCFEDGDCPNGQACKVGTGGEQSQNFAQQKPNDCSKDKNICGGSVVGGERVEEACATTTQGECSTKPYLNCAAGSTTCQDNDGGVCEISNRPCFETRITRTGVPSPLGKYCAFENKACTSNADCTNESDDFCANDASRPESVALFCVPATASTSINRVGGITGPGAVQFRGFVQVCRCGDGKIGCDETCDDANTVNGDGCDDYCQDE